MFGKILNKTPQGRAKNVLHNFLGRLSNAN